jgi:hypothetical protein
VDGLCRAAELGKLETMFDATNRAVAYESLLIEHVADDPVTHAMREWVAELLIGCVMLLGAVATTGLVFSLVGLPPQ